jgi:hypothetical protein
MFALLQEVRRMNVLAYIGSEGASESVSAKTFPI